MADNALLISNGLSYRKVEFEIRNFKQKMLQLLLKDLPGE